MSATLKFFLLIICSFHANLWATSHSQAEDPYPKNIILIIGDGMGLAHIGYAVHSSKVPLVFEQFPVVGLQKTHSWTNLITDSGASGTAMSCGEKTYNSAIGMKKDTTPCENLMELAFAGGKKTGMVVTSSLVHATPAAFVAHQKFRGFREAIAMDYTKSHLNYIVGGGLMYFTERSTDDRNLAEELEDQGYDVLNYKQHSFKQFSKKKGEKLIYFTSGLEPNKRLDGRLYLSKAVEHGMHVLDEIEDDGFFMLVEGSQIDFAGHENNKTYLLSEMRDFDEMLAKVMDFAQKDGETLVIVTADHSTGGLSIEGGKPDKQRVKASFSTSRHTPDMVPVFAYGPGAELFSGIYDNTEIFYKIRTLGGF